MKTLKIITVLGLSWCLAAMPALATLTATVNPGYTLSTGETPTTAKLNQLGQPTVTISGSVDGSTGLTAGSVAGNLLADSVPDGATLNYNGGAPRQLQIMPGGVSFNQINTNAFGRGLLGGYATGPASGSVITLNLDGITLVFTTNGAVSIAATFLTGLFFSYPLTPNFTNTWGYAQAFNITNYNITTPTNQWTRTTNTWNGTTITTNITAPAIADGDTMSILSTLQGTNTTVTPLALAGYVQNKLQTGSAVFTNLHRALPPGTWYFGGTLITSNNVPANGAITPLYQNTNTDFAMVADISGTVTGPGGSSYTVYFADPNTNTLRTISGPVFSNTIPVNRFIIPPHYGIYLTSNGGASPVSWNLTLLTTPY